MFDDFSTFTLHKSEAFKQVAKIYSPKLRTLSNIMSGLVSPERRLPVVRHAALQQVLQILLLEKGTLLSPVIQNNALLFSQSP